MMQAQRPSRSDAIVTADRPRKQTVSASGVFKKPSLAIRKKARVTPKKNAKVSRRAADVLSSAQKHQNGSARSSSDSPERAGHGKKSDLHPLALAFKGASFCSPYQSHN
jgi:hypothetical protein